jgi:hypothetical protein
MHTFEIRPTGTKCRQHAIGSPPGGVRGIQHGHASAKMLAISTPKIRGARQLIIRLRRPRQLLATDQPQGTAHVLRSWDSIYVRRQGPRQS